MLAGKCCFQKIPLENFDETVFLGIKYGFDVTIDFMHVKLCADSFVKL